jgi:hypothetical protein
MKNDARLQVGFRDTASFSAGVLVPMLLECSALIIAISVYVGAGAGPGLTVGMMTGLVLALSLEMLRRHVLIKRESGGANAVAVLRALIWVTLVAAPFVLAFVAIGTFDQCFGQTCDTLSWFVMRYMLAFSVVALLLIPLGYRLLKRAVWLQAGKVPG